MNWMWMPRTVEKKHGLNYLAPLFITAIFSDYSPTAKIVTLFFL